MLTAYIEPSTRAAGRMVPFRDATRCATPDERHRVCHSLGHACGRPHLKSRSRGNNAVEAVSCYVMTHAAKYVMD